MMYSLIVIGKAKARIVKNNLLCIKKHPPLKIGFVSFVSSLLLYSGYFLLYRCFYFIENFSYFGPFLVDRLLSFFFMSLFCMLIFSNIIVCFSTLFVQEESNFLITLPIGYKEIFTSRFIESIFLSSWTFLILVTPLIVAYGRVRSCEVYFYLLTFLLFIPFVIIPAIISAIIVMILARIFPIRRSGTLFFALCLLLIPVVVFMIRFKGFREIAVDPLAFLSHLMKSLRFCQFFLLPNHWLARSLSFAGDGNYSEAIFYFLVLIANVIFGLEILLFIAPKIYYKGFTKSQGLSKSTGYSTHREKWLEFLLKILPSPIRALVIKDIRLFVRDPTQWSQFLIFFGLIAIYIANIRSMPYEIEYPFWKGLILYLNIGSMGLVLAMLTTRFFFPLFSLEGKRFWLVGLAPIQRRLIIYEKLFLCTIISLLITEGLMIFSNIMLKTSLLIMVISCSVTFLMSISLVSLSIGLGMIYPNFREDAPSRIVSGLGGTINAILSLMYVALTTVILSYPFQLYLSGRETGGAIILAIACISLLSVLTTIVPLGIGFGRLKRMEF
ncbi:MAG: hypothetical protein QME40_06935 [bacterium]|nr:hypothetical protein [bacterium]